MLIEQTMTAIPETISPAKRWLLGWALYFAGCGGQVQGPAVPSDAKDAAVDAAARVCVEAGVTESGAARPIPLGVYGACSSNVVEKGRTAVGPGGSLTLSESNGALTVDVGKGVFA